jgi:hypothetical protein
VTEKAHTFFHNNMNNGMCAFFLQDVEDRLHKTDLDYVNIGNLFVVGCNKAPIVKLKCKFFLDSNKTKK